MAEEKPVKWAGCNYWINTGKVESEPVGTATSMHDCGACDQSSICRLQKDESCWPYTEDWGRFSAEETQRLQAIRRKSN